MQTTAVFGFIGFGLMGGSIAKAIRLFIPNVRIIAFDVNTPSLYRAAADGVVDDVRPAIDKAFSACTYIFLCAPVSANEENMAKVKPVLDPGTLLTDVGSVKRSTSEAARALGLSRQFIGAHPMTGSEKTGYENAKALLLENAYFLLMPEPEVPKEAVSAYENLVKTLHGLPLTLTCERHDEITAAVSHLPHIAAASLVNFVRQADDASETMKELAAGGFKDITRIASSSPAMWEAICQTNSGCIEKALTAYIASLTRMKEHIARHESREVFSFFSEARDYRDSLADSKRGPIAMSYVLYCDLIDEAGGIATIATILGTNGISIKNIGIIHNREFEEGVLRMEFYDEASLTQGVRLLKHHHYTIYTR